MKTLSLMRRLLAAAREHQRAEARLFELLRDTLPGEYLRSALSGPGIVRSVRKNFFSILFLAVYQAIGIPAERRALYGAVNHCLRGLVTATDNILDNEYKEMLPLRFAESAVKFKSVMHILLFDRFLAKVIEEAAQTGVLPPGRAGELQDALFQALVPIGAEEATEEGGVTTILPPAELLSTVHMYKGGRLLCLAFVAPLLIETKLRPAVERAESGIYSIGMALQVIDDLTDFYQDLADRRHNYLVAWVHAEGPPAEKARLAGILAQDNRRGPPVEDYFPVSLRVVMDQAIGEALHGFGLLDRAGFHVDRRAALRLIRRLFLLRGVKHLLPFFPAKGEGLHTLVHHAT